MDRPPVATIIRLRGNESLESLYRPACPRRTLRQIEEDLLALVFKIIIRIISFRTLTKFVHATVGSSHRSICDLFLIV